MCLAVGAAFVSVNSPHQMVLVSVPSKDLLKLSGLGTDEVLAYEEDDFTKAGNGTHTTDVAMACLFKKYGWLSLFLSPTPFPGFGGFIIRRPAFPPSLGVSLRSLSSTWGPPEEEHLCHIFGRSLCPQKGHHMHF